MPPRLTQVAALIAIFCVLHASSAPTASTQSAPPKAPPQVPAPAAASKPAAPAPAPRDLDGGWPRDYASQSGGAVRLFQPQVSSWDGQKRMVAFAAVSYAAKGATKPALGTVKVEAQ